MAIHIFNRVEVVKQVTERAKNILFPFLKLSDDDLSSTGPDGGAAARTKPA